MTKRKTPPKDPFDELSDKMGDLFLTEYETALVVDAVDTIMWGAPEMVITREQLLEYTRSAVARAGARSRGVQRRSRENGSKGGRKPTAHRRIAEALRGVEALRSLQFAEMLDRARKLRPKLDGVPIVIDENGDATCGKIEARREQLRAAWNR